jgi:RNA polymerase sigma-70 factor (ECF subfamily)
MTYDLVSYKAAFERIYLSFCPKLIRFANEYILSLEDAENIVQDLFMELWEQKYPLGELEYLQAYLFKSVKYKCIDFMRRQITAAKNKQTMQETWMREYEYNLLSLESFDEQAFPEDVYNALQKAIQSLPQRCREILIASKLDGMSHRQIAEKFNLSPATVNNHITLAMKKLKEKLTGTE